MNEIDAAWAAGLFEGEGSVLLFRPDDPRRWRAILSVEMTDEDVVRRFAEVVGLPDHVYPQRQRRQWKPTWRFSVGARAEIIRILETLLPFLGDRRRQKASETIEWLRGSVKASAGPVRCWTLPHVGRTMQGLPSSPEARAHA